MRILSKSLSTLAVMMLVACSGHSPEDTAKDFTQKSYEGDAEAVIAMIHFPDQEKNKPGVEDMLNGKVKAAVSQQKAYADEYGGIDEISADPAVISGENNDAAQVEVHIRFKQGETKDDNVRLIKTDDGWKVRL
ncbi:DUF4878 domain-containing protein [Neisseria zalophi]|uniref:DUF4878 domain-containing protein n=1 Tax=Neisseria zalophi TaxID=640030 RepID=A0A5J6PSJ5_9NEIS|nr:DUF4878 domain-containing protein [Neisseria zalophi]QEY25336.1 DUF4878 domain-containing protein [Neisseria zalophi]